MDTGSRLAQYVIQEPIGQGGMGTVYLARDELIGRDVALKLVLAEPGLDPDTSAELYRRLLREAQTAGVLSHPNIITVLHAGVEAGILFIAMELIHGCSLDRLAAERRIPVWLAASILGQAAAALDYAHGSGVLHRDVKPSNILVSRHGWVKLCDFGIAKWLSVPSSTASMALIGSPAYMSPEQGRNAGVGPAADQYSLAVVAYEILSGAQPFRADNLYSLLHCHLALPPPVEPLERANLPERAISALLRGLAKNPGDRYPSCAAFVADLFAAWHEDDDTSPSLLESGPVVIGCPCAACRGTIMQLSPSAAKLPYLAAPPAQGAKRGNSRTASAPEDGDRNAACPPASSPSGQLAIARRLLRGLGAISGLALLLLTGFLSLSGLRSLLSTYKPASLTEKAEEGAATERSLDESFPIPYTAGGEGGRRLSDYGAVGPRRANATGMPRPAAARPAESGSDSALLEADSNHPASLSLAYLPFQQQAPWPTHGGNQARNGLVDAEGLRQAAVAWTLRLDADVTAGPVIDREGRIFVALSNGTAAAVEGGRISWILPLPERPASGLDVVEGGLVRVWLQKGGMAAFTANGGKLMRIDEGQRDLLEAAMDPARRLFFVSGRWLRCTGLPGWGLALPEESVGPPLFDDASGVVVVCTRDGSVFAINSGGGVEWSLKVSGRLSSKAAAMPDGGVVVGGLDGSLYLIRSGEVLWRQMLEAPIRGSAAVSRDGLIHAAAGDGWVYGLDSRGKVLWRHSLGSEVRAGPALDDRGHLYVVTAAGKLACLSDPRLRDRRGL